MSETKKVVERMWSAMEKNRLDEIDELLAPDCHFKMPGFELRGGAAELKPMLSAYITAFPDLKHEVKHVVESNGTIAIELNVTGTHVGPMQTPEGTIPATGKKILWESCDYVRVVNGKVVSWHAYYDNTPFLTALGLMRPAA